MSDPRFEMKEILAGRERELELLTDAFEQACNGSGRIVMVGGDAGIGKTRLVEALEDCAAAREVEVHWGGCLESGIAPPYWPWVEALRSYFECRETDEQQERLLDALGNTAALFAHLIPEQRSVVPDLPTLAATVEPAASRFRLFDTVATVLKRASSQTPIVIVLEDLHWADQSTLDLLEFVSHSLRSSRLCVIGTHRDQEGPGSRPFHKTLGDLSRQRTFRSVHLSGLGEDSVREVIENESGSAPPAGLVAEIQRITDGNPLYVIEMVRVLMRHRSPDGETDKLPAIWELGVPATIRVAIGKQLATLSDECNELLRAAAVIGRKFSVELLQRLAHETHSDQTIKLLDEALQSRVVRAATGSGPFEFTHELIRETIAEEMSLSEHLQLHAGAAMMLEGFYNDQADEHAAEVVEHFVEAESILGKGKVAHYSLLAGQQAAKRFAWEEARAHFQRGLEAKSNEAMDNQKARLLFGLAQMDHVLVDQFPPPNDRFDMARSAYDHFIAQGLTDEAVRVAIAGISRIEPDGTTTTLTDAALSMVERESREEGLLLCLRASVLLDAHDHAAAEPLLDRARVIGEKLDDPWLLLRVYTNMSTVRWLQWRKEESFAATETALRYATAVDDVRAVTECMVSHAWACVKSGRTDEARRAITRLKDHTMNRDSAYHPTSLMLEASLTNRTGEWSAAVAALDEVVLESTDPQWISALALRHGISRELGEPESGKSIKEIISILQESLDQNRFGQVYNGIWTMAYVALSTGDRTFIEGLEPVINTVAVGTSRPYQSAGEQAFQAWIIPASRRMIAVVRDDREAAIEYYERWKASGRAADPSNAVCFGYVAGSAGKIDEAADLFGETLEFDRGAGYRARVARHCYDCAALLVGRAASAQKMVADGVFDLERASDLLKEGHSIALDLGMVLLESRITAVVERIGALRAEPAGAAARGTIHPDGLSEREVGVMRLVVKGFTNKEVADLLHISRNTVSTHLKHFYKKTGTANRAEASVYAERAGLLDE